MKKVLSVVLALAMVLALAVPAFASAQQTDTTMTDIAKAATGSSTEMKGETKVPTINIVVPKTSSIVVNPYQIKVKVDNVDVQDTVIAPTSYITNKSDIKMEVYMTVTGKPGSGVTFVTAAPTSPAAGTTTTVGNDVFLTFEAAPVADNTSEPDWGSAQGKTSVVVDRVAKKLDGQGSNPAGITLDACAASGTDLTPNYIAYHVKGSAQTAPTKAWTATMTAGVTVAFTFKPVANTVTEPDEGGDDEGGGTPPADANPAVSASITSGTPGDGANLTLTATLTDIDASKNPTYAWAVDSDADSIIDSFSDGGANTQTVNLAASNTSGKTATVKVTVNFDKDGSGDGEVTDTVTITVP